MAHQIPQFVSYSQLFTPHDFLIAMACFTTALLTLRVTSEIISRRAGVIHWITVLAMYLFMSFCLYWLSFFLSGFGTWGIIGMLLLLPSQLAVYESLCEACKTVPSA